MMSMLGSARETPAQGQVKFVPSMRNRFSLPPDPNADTVFTVPLDGEVGDTPGAALIESNMLNRRVGMVRRYSGPNRVSNPLLRASMREPEPWTTTDSASPATSTRRFSRVWHPRRCGRLPRDRARIPATRCRAHKSREAERGIAIALSRPWCIVAGPPISAGEVTRTRAPGMTAPCSSLTVPTRAPSGPAHRLRRQQHTCRGQNRRT